MATRIRTCSEAISLSRELEDESARVYEELATRWPEVEELFSSFATENRKYVKQIERAYYGVITDALEGGFAFDLDPQEYRVDPRPSAESGFADVLREALAMEQKSLGFDEIAAEQSKHLMADVPRTLTLVAKKRRERIARLETLLEQAR